MILKLLAFLSVTTAFAAAPEVPPMPIPQRLLLVAPHPDDVLLGAGLVQRTRAQGGQARVIDLTCGDGNSPAAFRYIAHRGFHAHPQKSVNYGYFRQQEDLAANALAGAGAGDLVFLGYPDGGLWKMLTRANEPDPVRSTNTGMEQVPYENAFRPGAPYRLESIVADLAAQMAEFRPDLIIAPHPNDHHSDHAAAHAITRLARERAGLGDAEAPVYSPLDQYGHEMGMTLKREQRFAPPRHAIPSPTRWHELDLTHAEVETKIRMTSLYKSQLAWEHPLHAEYDGTVSYLFGYIGANELYGYVEAPREDAAFRERVYRQTMLRRGLSWVGNVVGDAWEKAEGRSK